MRSALGWREPSKLIEEVEGDDERWAAGRRGIADRVPDHQEPLTVRRHVVASTRVGRTREILSFEALLDADHPSTLIVPLTTRLVEDAEALRIRIRKSGALRKDSDLLIEQVRAFDNHRLTQGPLRRLAPQHLRNIGAALREVLELIED